MVHSSSGRRAKAAILCRAPSEALRINGADTTRGRPSPPAQGGNEACAVWGHIEEESGVIELPFRLDVDNRPHQIYDEVYGKMRTTHWKHLSYEGDCTRVEFIPITGRTHQLRLHAAHEKGLGFPIVGDFLYGNGTDTNQLKLHAQYLGFSHPETGEWIEFETPVPF